MGINLAEGLGPGPGGDEEESMEGLRMKMEELKAVKVVGKGAIGTVFLVHKEGCDKPLALKAMSKSVIENHNDGFKRARAEREILRRLHHPFLPSLVGYVETDKVVGFVVDYCPGGDLNLLRRRQSEKMFSESIIRFYAAEIILGLEHLHSLGVVYRDLKPENILVQSSGHIMLTDFDLSTRLRPRRRQPEPSAGGDSGHAGQPQSQIRRTRSGSFAYMTSCMTSHAQCWGATRVSPVTKTSKKSGASSVPSTKTPSSVTPSYVRANSFVGTEEYVSPEMLRGDGHDFAVDWWALGILLYEMLHGKTPFRGATRKETFYHILVRQPQFTGPWTPLRDLILRLLEKDPKKRLVGAAEVKTHLFFRGLDWEALENVSRAPFVPPPVTCEDLIREEMLNVEEYLEKQAESKLKEEKNSVVKSPDKEEKNGVVRSPGTEDKDAFTVF